MIDYDFNKIINDLDFKSGEFVTCPNGLMLTNKEIEVLKRYNIEYNNCSTLKEILYLIEELINEEYDDMDDLDFISNSISERDYYLNSNK